LADWVFLPNKISTVGKKQRILINNARGIEALSGLGGLQACKCRRRREARLRRRIVWFSGWRFAELAPVAAPPSQESRGFSLRAGISDDCDDRVGLCRLVALETRGGESWASVAAPQSGETEILLNAIDFASLWPHFGPPAIC
jgi:hypothetical protein